jgi:hypothetical protein
MAVCHPARQAPSKCTQISLGAQDQRGTASTSPATEGCAAVDLLQQLANCVRSRSSLRGASSTERRNWDLHHVSGGSRAAFHSTRLRMLSGRNCSHGPRKQPGARQLTWAHIRSSGARRPLVAATIFRTSESEFLRHKYDLCPLHYHMYSSVDVPGTVLDEVLGFI